MLPPDTQRRLVKARLDEVSYRPKDDISAGLREKKLIMFVSPSATGKTFVMQQLKNIDPRFSLVPVFTTREPRKDDDPDLFRNLPHTNESITAILNQISNRELIQYAVHPTQSHIYGTELSGYKTEYNLLATMSGAVEQFRALPFEKTYTISIVPRAEVWPTWFNYRYPEGSPNRQKRLEEALISLTWLLDDEQQSSVLFIENIDDDPAATARSSIEAIISGQATGDAIGRAYEMKAWAKNALARYSPEEAERF